MDNSIYEKIGSNPRFNEFVKKRQLFAWGLSLIMLLLYFSFILMIAFMPSWLGTPVYEGSSITRGIPIGVGLIITSFILTGVYVIRANGEFDNINQQLFREAQQ